MKNDCKNCIIRDLFDNAFKSTITKLSYDLTRTDHCCGCIGYYLYDDTPGFREKDEWFENEKCILKDPGDSYPLPQYKGPYEDLLKANKESLYEA